MWYHQLKQEQDKRASNDDFSEGAKTVPFIF